MPDPDRLALDYAYHWERTRPEEVYLTQPGGRGQVQTFTWKRTMDQVRRMAAHLRSLDLPAGSNIAIFSQNSAYWIMADLAIWMAGHASVMLFPTLGSDTIRYILEHSDSKLVFIGKVAAPAEARSAVPDGLAKIALPLSPPSDFPDGMIWSPHESRWVTTRPVTPTRWRRSSTPPGAREGPRGSCSPSG